MTCYVLDTDMVSLAMHAHPIVMERILEHDSDVLAVSVITIEEQVRGWYDQLRKAKTDEMLARTYRRLGETVEAFSDLHVLPFEVPTISRFRSLERMKLQVRSMDLRIAATVLECNAILVTRNLRDFERIPGLTIEDWTE